MRSRIGGVEREIIRFLYGRQVQSPSIQKIPLFSRNSSDAHAFRIALHRLIERGLVKCQDQGILCLSAKGALLARYIDPFPLSREHQATILVPPQIASQETGFSLKSLLRKRGPFYFLSLPKRRLYVLKKEFISPLRKKFPFFPLIEIFDIPQIIPDAPDTLVMLIRSNIPPLSITEEKELYDWNKILTFLMEIGKIYQGGANHDRKFKAKKRTDS